MKKIDKLKIEIYADGAELLSFKKLKKLGYIKGYTTNPSLMRKAGVKNYKIFAKKVIEIVKPKPISFEIFEDTSKKIEEQANKISKWGENVYVKIPVINTKKKFNSKLIGKLNKNGIKLNVTAIFTIDQTKNIIKYIGKKTPIILLNARITKKSFKRWKILKNFADKIFQCFSNTYPCNKETQDFLKFFGVKNIQLIDNLKFTQKKITNNKIPYKLSKFFKNRDFWCASSTHNGEEEICINSHQELKKNYKNFVSIIIPRHVDRKEEIIDILKNNNLKFYCHSSNKPIPNDTEVYLVDTYGETEVFYNLNKVVFMGGSMIKHGGQNPLEAVRHGCKIIHGPNVENFRDIYKLLDGKNISKKIKSKKSLIKQVKQCLKSGKRSNLIVKKIDDIGIDILKAITKELKIIIK